MKCKTHDKHLVLWEDPCVEKRVPYFWKRIDKVAWLVGLDATFSSLNKIKITQTKEKYGYTNVYYSYTSCCKMVNGNGKHTNEPTTPKALWKAMERQRRLNPDLAHHIYDFTPYKCKCKDDFWCKRYSKVSLLQKYWDKIFIKFLEFYGHHSSKWCLLKGGFVVYGRQWGLLKWQKVKRTFKRPF